MNNISDRRFDTVNAVIAAGVTALVLLIYILTKAPTLSFWDCGEFIAAGYTLGVPHPPGSPVYILIARIFSILPVAADIAVRVNLLSSICNALAAMFGYLAVVRILRLWYDTDRSTMSRFLIHAGGVTGALFMAFGRTQWTNSVETEVYGMTMLLFMASFWLTLVYYENQGRPLGDKVLLLVVYLATLGIGVHLTAFMILPVAALFFMLAKSTPARYWFIVAAFFALELFLIVALSARPGEIPYFVPILIVLIFYAFYVFSFDAIPLRSLLVGLGFVLSVSPVYLYLVYSTNRPGTRQALMESPLAAALNVVSLAAFCLLVAYAVYVIVVYMRARARENQPAWNDLVTGVMILAAGLMTLILISGIKGYLAFLGLSALLTVILAALTWRHLRWPFLIAVIALSLVIIGVKPYFFGLVAAAVVIPIVGKTFRLTGWKVSLLVLLVAAMGYSAHLYLPIRSAQSPIINQNNPSKGLDTTIRYLERQQYGTQGMVERMFERRAEWSSQFGNYHRLGFWRFFNEQYGLTGPKFFILLILGLYGVWEVVRRKPKIGAFLIILLLITSIGLVLYMNFADGLRQDAVGRGHIEVRDRDYFFTPVFVLFGLVMGIGVTLLIQFVREMIRGYAPGSRRVIIGALCVLFLLPAYALAGNYHVCDRSRNYIPYDYAHALLASCEENAVLFTGGDNDTFPIWCLQEVYGFRRDVAVVCLPLANTDWYIKQLRDDLGLELGWSDRDIDQLRSYRLPDGRTFRLQDQVIDAIVDNNLEGRPLHFGVVVGRGNRKLHGYSADSLMIQRGMVFKLRPEGEGLIIDIPTSLALLKDTSVFRFRGLNDPTVYKDEASQRATRNLANSMLMILDSLRSAADWETSESLARFLLTHIPGDPDGAEFLATAMMKQDRLEELQALIDSNDYSNANQMRVMLARGYRLREDPSRAATILRGVLATDGSHRAAFEELTRLHFAAQDFPAIEQVFDLWLKDNPGDRQVAGMLQELRRQLAEPSDTGVTGQ